MPSARRPRLPGASVAAAAASVAPASAISAAPPAAPTAAVLAPDATRELVALLSSAVFPDDGVAHCERLLVAGADPSARCPQGRPALSLAAVHFKGEPLVELLLRAGADPLGRDGDGELPLLAALSTRREEAALRLASATAAAGPGGRLALDRPGRDGLPPLALAASRGLGRAVMALLAHGATADAAEEGGLSALMAAMNWPWLPEEWLIPLMEASDLWARDGGGRTALDWAVEAKNWGGYLALRAVEAPGSVSESRLLAQLAERGVDRRSRLAAAQAALADLEGESERDLAAASLIGSLLADGWQDIGELAPLAPEFSARLVLTLASGVPAREREAAPFAARLAVLARPEDAVLH